MNGSNAGVPVSRPASAPIVRGPFRIWRGHPSPIPWFGRFEADDGHSYTVTDRESEDSFGPLCETCVVELIYRYRGFCDVAWTPIGTRPLTCDWCDRVFGASQLDAAPAD